MYTGMSCQSFFFQVCVKISRWIDCACVRGEGILASYYARSAKFFFGEFRGLDQACARGGNFGKLLRALRQIFFGEFRGLDQACAGMEFWQVITFW
jgi:hypothetical protein